MNAYERADDARRRAAVTRCAALLDVAALQSCGASLAEARAQVARQRCVSVASLKRWGRVVRDVPRAQWSARLLPVPRRSAAP